MRNFISVIPDLHMVVTIAQRACDHVLNRVLKLSTYRLQIFLAKYEYMRLFYNYLNTKASVESLKDLLTYMCLRSLRPIRRRGLKLRPHKQFFIRDRNAIFRNYCVAFAWKNCNTAIRCDGKIC